MSRERTRQELIDFLRTIQRPGGSIDAIDDEQNLFDSGVIDSLAMLQIILLLEQSYGIDLSESGVDPTQLNSVSSILDMIERGPPC
jgi:acyl carrier protein